MKMTITHMHEIHINSWAFDLISVAVGILGFTCATLLVVFIVARFRGP